MKLVKTLLALMPLVVLAACADSTTGTLGFSVTTRPATAVAATRAALAPGAPMPSVTAAGDTTVIALGSDTVIVRSAELVLRKVELKRSDAAACDSMEGNGDCEEFETGATLVTLPLGTTAITQDVAISAPAGTFDGLEFEIHKPSGGDDAAFIAANPDFANISIRVTGTFVHGTGSGAGTRSDFVFTSDVDQSEEQILNPPVTVADGQTINVTLRVDISTWFLNETQTALVDPASANKGNPNESIVANNIQNSFGAFEDDNRDGLDN
jgi:hypothetical protein